jgi:cytochrome c oxidase subunit 1
MILAMICGALLLIAFLVFFINIVMTIGLKGLLGIFKATKNKDLKLLPDA